jgi:hypothetical protein
MADPTVIKDPVYSFEIARRAVGRAALHLGIDSMTEQALDVMADVLLQYLARTGRALSHLAESSRRTSAHVNVLDAFQATQLVASPAVGRLHLQEPDEEEEEETIANPAPNLSDGAPIEGAPVNGNGSMCTSTNASGPSSIALVVPSNGSSTQPNSVSSSSSSSSRSSTGWKALASFVFGPNWLQEKDDEEYLMELAAKNGADASSGEARVLSTSGAGGKVFPSSLENGVGGNQLGGVGDMGTLRRKRKKGWDAPYPDDVPAFPKATSTCANPHALPARVTGGLSSSAASGSTAYRKVDVDANEADEDEQEALDELEALSDEVFLPHPESMKSDTAAVGDSAWGSIDGKRKQNLENVPGTAVTKDEDGDVEMQPSMKKIKSENSKITKAGNAKGEALPKKEAGALKTIPAQEEFLYVPTFYPRPPSTKVVVDDRRTVVDGIDDRQQRLLQQQRAQQQQEQQVFASEDAIETLEGTSNSSLRSGAMNMDSSRGVRSSLIRLGSNSYWGSGWEKASSSASSAPTLAVPMGRKASGPSASGGPGGRAAAPDDPIIPMSRASGSRVSRVLEGSMDAAAMQ